MAWKSTARARFRGSEPALQVLEFVQRVGNLSDDQVEAIESQRFNLTTLKRLIASRSVREQIGIEIRNKSIHSGLPAAELIKPLQKFVVDILDKSVTSRSLHTSGDQQAYVRGLGRVHRPSLSKAGVSRSIEEISQKAKGKKGQAAKARPAADDAERPCLIPAKATITVSDAKIAAIASELKKLRVDTYCHAVSVLFRVFLELSTDHYMKVQGLSLTYVRNGQRRDKKLVKKIDEVIKDMVATGSDERDFKSVVRGLNDIRSPLHMDLLHGYVHNRFVIPKSHNLLAAWDESRPYFEAIWS